MTAPKLTKLLLRALALLALALVAAGWWGLRSLLKHDFGGVSGLVSCEPGKDQWIERVGPGGLRYSVNAGPATYRLEMRPEDGHSQRVFTSYGAALRYAREQKLNGMPSASLVLATCSAGDFRLQAALEMALDADPQAGRVVLLENWLESVVARRTLAPPAAMAAYDSAATWLASAILFGGGNPRLPDGIKRPAVGMNSAANDPALGPWATSPALAAIWRRDRFLARGIVVSDDASAAVAAVLARTVTEDGPLADGWKHQLAVSRVLHGKETGATFELLAARLAGVTDDEIAGPAAVEIVRAAVTASGFHDDRPDPAPAALSWVMTPEETVLKPLAMKAWNDPTGCLVRAIRAGQISLAPGPDAGFYRERWFALETLAAPALAPEAIKLQLSADYQRRWQRAFAAGFTEGRSGFVKRLPVMVMGSNMPGKVPVAIAPQFTAEPAPVVYLRLARAYHKLDHDLSAVIGADPWCQLRDADGKPVAAGLRHRAEVLYGLARKVYREVGFAPPWTGDESAMDFAAAEAAADAWCAALEADPDINRDARLLVTLAADGMGSYRCPAVLGVRLEPVEYFWEEIPLVSGDVEAGFVPARYWLTSPIPATVTVNAIPTPAEFRKSCDSHASVCELCRAFGQSPPVLHTPGRRWWRWPAAGLVLLVCGLGLAYLWRKSSRRCRRYIKSGLAAGFAVVLAAAIFAPPPWLLRQVLVRVLMVHTNIALVTERWFIKWTGNHRVALVTDLLGDPDPQIRYLGARLWTDADMLDYMDEAKQPPFTDAQLALCRSRIHDEVPEVGWACWEILCRHADEVPFLVGDLERGGAPQELKIRLRLLARSHPNRPEVVEVALKLVADPRPTVRAATLASLGRWEVSAPALDDAIRAATRDADALVREQAAVALDRTATTVDLPILLDMWRDPDARVRVAAFKAVGGTYYHRNSSVARWQWSDEPIQNQLVRYVRNPAAAVHERISAARWIADPATLRATCRELLPDVRRLPENVVYDGTHRRARSKALALLAARWVLADQYARLTLKAGASEKSYELERYPALLDSLADCIAQNRSAATTRQMLRDMQQRPGHHDAVLALIHGLEKSAKTSDDR